MESEFIAWLRNRLPDYPHVELGIGDDAAVLTAQPSAASVVTSDMMSDGVDFLLSQCDPELVGRKALAVNLSDLAAMAAEPVAAVVSLTLPSIGALELAKALYRGILPLADTFGIAIVGGDTNTWDGPLVISVTAIGQVTGGRPLMRSGAQTGDAVMVTGSLGGSILRHHFTFTPRVREVIQLHCDYRLHAGTDISDGLTLDLSNILTESRCGAELQLDRIPVSRAAVDLATQQGDGISPLEHALSDGEDFELILTADPDEAERLITERPLDTAITRIGTIVAESGLWSVDDQGNRLPLMARGYRH